MAATSSRTRRAARTVFSLPLLPVTFLCFSMAAWASNNSSVCQSTMDDDATTTLMDFSKPTSLEEFNKTFPQLKISETKNNNIMFELNKGITTVEKDVLDPNKIVFKNGGKAYVTFLTEGAGYSSLFGYIRMKDIQHYFEYDEDGTERLRDCDKNNIPDFHEDLFSMRLSDNSRGGGGCVGMEYFKGNDIESGFSKYYDYTTITTQTNENKTCDDATGEAKDRCLEYGDLYLPTVTEPDDGGVFPMIPNLLEPPAPKNNNLGVGRIIYSQADYYNPDGSNQTRVTSRSFYNSSMNDRNYEYGLRDKISGRMNWKVEDMCLDGKKRGQRTGDEWCTVREEVPKDGTRRTVRVELKEDFEPGEEIIFFLLVDGSTSNSVCYVPNRKSGRCDYPQKRRFIPYFTKQILNADAMTTKNASWAKGYDKLLTEGKTVIADQVRNPNVTVTWQTKEFGWLFEEYVNEADLFIPSLEYKKNIKTNGTSKTFLKAKKNVLSRGTVGEHGSDNFPRFPHAFSANFSWNPYYWVIGFEDQTVDGGGDWDYEDVAFIIEKKGGGIVRSEVVTGDAMGTGVASSSICTGKECDTYAITNVVMRIKDLPHRECTGSCSSIQKNDSNSCKNSSITYELATDCEVWDDSQGKYVVNNTPKWRTIDTTSNCIKDTSDQSYKICKVNLSLEGYTGSRLCWRAHFVTQDETKCRPLLQAFDIRYDMMRPGTYSRSSPSSMSNKIFYGAWEMIPPKEPSCTDPKKYEYELNSGTCYLPSTHYQDNSDDYTARGHFVFRDLYQLTDKGESLTCADECVDANKCAAISSCWKWDGGKKLIDDLTTKIGSPEKPTRQLYTSDSEGKALSIILDKSAKYSKIYQEMLRLGLRQDGTYESTYNFDKDSTVTPNNDGGFLVKWLLGWEHPDTNNTTLPIIERRRAWPMGAFEFSTPAIVGPPTLNPRLHVLERDLYTNNYSKKYYDDKKDRPAVAYMGSSDGFVHAFDTGVFRFDKKINENDKALTGAFKTHEGKDDTGTGTEIFAFIPRKQLHRIVNNYLRQAPMALAESSPSVADIDLGEQGNWTRKKDSPTPLNNAMTALAMAAGRGSPVVFALDVTDIDYDKKKRAPIPLWELDLANDRIFNNGDPDNLLTLEEYAKIIYSENFVTSSGKKLNLNTSSARHSPTITRLYFRSPNDEENNKENKNEKPWLKSRWVGVFSSDYGDGGSVGAVYLINFKTGLPVTTSKENGAVSEPVGVINAEENNLRGLYLLKQGEGVGGEIPAVDVDEDGIAEVLYVPTTQGRIYKINTETDKSCVFVDLHEDLKTFADAHGPFVALGNESSGPALIKDEHFKYQNIYSSISVSIDSARNVHLYVGTGNNPDDASDDADKLSDIYYWVAGITDTNVKNAEQMSDSDRCAMGFDENTGFTATPLAKGHSVWGGVASSNSGPIAVTSAEGTSADACHLKTGEGTGYIYQFDDPADLPGSAAKQGQEGGASVKATDAPVISAPIFVNGQVVAVSATAKVETIGDGNFNQPAQFDAVINMLNWQRVPSNKIAP